MASNSARIFRQAEYAVPLAAQVAEQIVALAIRKPARGERLLDHLDELRS
jgi:hypothetical protein